MSRIDWWIIQGSNLERTGYEPAALPVELMIRIKKQGQPQYGYPCRYASTNTYLDYLYKAKST